jgi:homoserine dehydrogenase
MVSVIGTTGTGFLQNDASWRTLERLPPGDLRSPYYLSIEVDDRPGVLAHVALRLAADDVSVARLSQRQLNGAASLDIVTHEASMGSVRAAAAALAHLPEVHGEPDVIRVVSERG